jgi:hypothetical protein
MEDMRTHLQREHSYKKDRWLDSLYSLYYWGPYLGKYSKSTNTFDFR